jgi:nuclear transport factor 2 (NTF2) superfamily protein
MRGVQVIERAENTKKLAILPLTRSWLPENRHIRHLVALKSNRRKITAFEQQKKYSREAEINHIKERWIYKFVT